MIQPTNILQVSGEWLQKVNRYTNIKAGPGIKLTRDGNGLKIEADQDQFKQWLWAAIYRGMIRFNREYTNCTNGVALANLDQIILDPGL